jgi:peptidyl-prolyl cis-trans isomerase SurA
MKNQNRFSILMVVLISAIKMPGLWSQEVVVLDEIVAKINQEIITLTDLQRELRTLRNALEKEIQNPQDLENEFARQKRPVLKTMVQNTMLIQKAEELGITAGIDLDVAAALEENRKQAGIPTLEVLDQYLRQQGSSLDEYRQTLKQRMIVESLLQQYVYSRLTLLTPEIEAFYQENIGRFTEQAEVNLREILFLTEGKDPAEVRKRAEDVLSRLHSGASFEDLAKQYSDGPTASRGGDIGSFKKNSMAAPIEEVVFELVEGDLSDIIETDYGLQIIKVVGKKEDRAKPLEEVRSGIVRELYMIKAEPGVSEFMEEVRGQSYVYIAPKYREEFDVEGF